jgi:hypothetical protein
MNRNIYNKYKIYLMPIWLYNAVFRSKRTQNFSTINHLNYAFSIAFIRFIFIYLIMEIGKKYNKNDAKRHSNVLTITESSLKSDG